MYPETLRAKEVDAMEEEAPCLSDSLGRLCTGAEMPAPVTVVESSQVRVVYGIDTGAWITSKLRT